MATPVAVLPLQNNDVQAAAATAANSAQPLSPAPTEDADKEGDTDAPPPTPEQLRFQRYSARLNPSGPAIGVDCLVVCVGCTRTLEQNTPDRTGVAQYSSISSLLLLSIALNRTFHFKNLFTANPQRAVGHGYDF